MTATQTGTTVVLPSLGENVTEATITRWLTTVGDSIEEGEALLEVATDKVDTEIPAPTTGTVVELLAAEGEVIEIGAALALIGSAETKPSPPGQTTPIEPLTDEDIGRVGTPDHHASPPRTHTRPSTPEGSPSAPTATEAASVPTDSGNRVETLPRIRQTIARRMLESLQTSAQLTTVVEVDVTEIARLRTAHKEEFHRRTGMKLSFLPFFVAAAVDALDEHPVINASLNADCTEVTYHAAVHLGMAVDSDKGLMVPVIRHADRLNITELTRAIGDSADHVRSGTIRPDDLSGGTFTITNTGSRGALFDTPIINQPQSAILGIGTVVERLLPTRGDEGALQIEVRSMAYLSLSYDHRIVDGADAARYLTAMKHRLEIGFVGANLQ